MEIEIPENVDVWNRLNEEARKDIVAISVLEGREPMKMLLEWIYEQLNDYELPARPDMYREGIDELIDQK